MYLVIYHKFCISRVDLFLTSSSAYKENVLLILKKICDQAWQLSAHFPNRLSCTASRLFYSHQGSNIITISEFNPIACLSWRIERQRYFRKHPCFHPSWQIEYRTSQFAPVGDRQTDVIHLLLPAQTFAVKISEWWNLTQKEKVQ